MIVHVFDVSHGECVVVETPNDKLIMLGAADNPLTGWSPSKMLEYAGRRPDLLVLTNFDKDHLADLPNFTPTTQPRFIHRNYDLNMDGIVSAKERLNGEVSPGVAQAAAWTSNVFTGPRVNNDYGIQVQHFSNHPDDFGYEDTNNLSVVTFLGYSGVGVLNCSDIERTGLLKLLENPEFRVALANTHVLIAPHHGRENGYCAEIFNYATPDIVVVSDKPIVHATQAHSLYEPHVRGMQFPNGLRKVLTTRNDGKITITVTGPGRFQVHKER